MRYPGALWVPSPNFGYPRGARGQLRANIIASRGGGAFWHSQVGPQQAAIGRFLNAAEEASAHFLFPKVRGQPVVQMVDSADPAWHAGGTLKEDPIAGGPGIGTIANLFFHGFEFEGGGTGNYNEPLTDYQIEEAVSVCHWLEAIGEWPRVGVYVWRETLQQHRWVYPTACPSERINQALIAARLSAQQEDDMTPAQEEELRLLRISTNTLIAQMMSAYGYIANVDKALAAYRDSVGVNIVTPLSAHLKAPHAAGDFAARVHEHVLEGKAK
jgi:N-acetyl-anhydromuramyl-L-alanine amidase AmpD